MREILFRGKHIHGLSQNEHLNERWIYGYLCDKNYIYSPELEGEFLINPETVCQYTGLTDKSGRKVFEGDIVKIGLEQYEVWWNCDSSSLTLSNESKSRGLYLSHSETIEVIGNIFDNPGLIGDQP